MCAEKNLIETIKEVKLSNFACSSSETLNSVIDDLSRTIDEDFCQENSECFNGLEKLEIEKFKDRKSLEPWPLRKLVTKCTKLEHLKIIDLSKTTYENSTKLLDFVI